ncbi:MAG: hypothetical protein SPD88_03905 [Candidatus Ventricola sp.]|nr:hypothetical protein [Candidatus Ventricola sp.]
MDRSLLHVVSCVLRTQADADDALRQLRRLSAGDAAHTLLLFAGFHAANAASLPDDAPLLRRLQSGVMAMNARRPGRFLLLARRRVWDDASRQYLGWEQPLSCREVLAQLLSSGQTSAVFDAATVSPASLKGRFDAVLFSGMELSCTPDTPARMLAALDHAPCGRVAALIRHPRAYPETVFARLVRTCGFSLSPVSAARETLLARDGLLPAYQPTLFTAGALIASLDAPVTASPKAEGCFFMRRAPLTLAACFSAHRLHVLRRTDAVSFLPLVQLALLVTSALTGVPLLTALALLPEALALLHPRLLPGALLCTALLPLTAAVSLDALLCRLFARSRWLRLRLPDSLVSAQGCMLTGAVLLPLAIASVQALVFLLPILLLWLSAPLLLSALASPTLERIPLAEDQRAQLRTMAESAYFDAAQDVHAPAALRMLAACAGCMLGVLEPDEAARQTQALLTAEPAVDSPVENAALLVCAQFLRERMADCDAALRALPAQLEDYARKKAGTQTPFPSASQDDPLAALFLPLGPAGRTAQHAMTLPLTHPHTYLKRLLPDGNPTGDSLARFLALAAAALDHPFHALLLRSPVAAPYAVMMYV